MPSFFQICISPLQENCLQCVMIFLMYDKCFQHIYSFSLSFSLKVMPVIRFYRTEEEGEGRVIRRITQLYPEVTITTELCYYVELNGKRIVCSEMYRKEFVALLFNPFLCDSQGPTL